MDALTTEGNGGKRQANGKLIEAAAQQGSFPSQDKQVPHLRWSQAPPLPWERPGSADISLKLFCGNSLFPKMDVPPKSWILI